MLIRFENDLDDVLDWLDYHHSQSSTFDDAARWYKRMGLGLAAMGVLLGVISPSFLGLMAVAIGIFVYLGFPQLMYSNARTHARQMYEEGPMNGLIGRFELVADDDGVEIISDGERHYYDWSALDRVVQTDHHTFVYVNGLQAYIIPHDSVLEGDPTRLVQAKQRRQIDGRIDPSRQLEERIDRAAGHVDGRVDGGVRERKPAAAREPFDNGAEGFI